MDRFLAGCENGPFYGKRGALPMAALACAAVIAMISAVFLPEASRSGKTWSAQSATLAGPAMLGLADSAMCAAILASSAVVPQ